MNKKYIANVTISILVEAEDCDAAYDVAFDKTWECIEPASNTYIERIQIENA